MLGVVLWLGGCSFLVPEPAVSPDPAPVPAPQPERMPEPAVEAAEYTEKPVISPVPAPRQLPGVSILLSDKQSAFADVAHELAKHLDDYVIYDLSDSSRPPVSVLRLVNDSDSGVVVAIGLRAARASIALSKKPVIFSQVFNHQDHKLLGDNSRGVAAIAPIDAQLSAWCQLEPSLARIGMIIGEGHDDLIAEAEVAAQSQGVELQVHVSRSDQETLYLFKRMVHDIDGFWLLPDNRILSHRALRTIMDDAQSRQVRVLAPSESMLTMGASVSITTVSSDIAESIVGIIRRFDAGELARVPPVSRLTQIRVKKAGDGAEP